MIERGKLGQTATSLLRRLIAFDTVNPPGHEALAQAYVKEQLEAAGFKVDFFARDAVRPNLIATLRGAAEGPTVALLGHIDTVLADPAEWSVDPWSGTVKDGCVWGRGAQDMKGQVAAELAAAIELASSGWRPEAGTLKVIVTVDEEAGGNYGARWLCETHPAEAHADIILNEGGGQMFVYQGRRYFRVGCAEKGFCRFNIVAHGTAGHASVPKMGDNALLKLAGPLDRLANGQPGYDLTDEPRAILAALTGREPTEDSIAAMLDEVAAVDPRLAVLIEPTCGVTLTPTMARASEKVNVIPAHASVRVDCRVPPGLGVDHAERRAHEVLGEGDFALEFGESAIGNRSPHDTPLMDAIKDWIATVDTDAQALPSVLPGFTDSRWFRDAFPDCVAYGFFPQMAMDMFESEPLIHGADERIPVDDLALAASFFADVVPKLLR